MVKRARDASEVQ